MVDGETNTFDIVRRGYDTDQVDQFLRVQADAWAAELDGTRRANSELEERVSSLLDVESENERLRQGEADFNERKAAAARIQEESLAASRADIEDLRRQTEEETARMRAEAEAEVAEKLKQAEEATADADRKARAAAEAVLKEHQGVLDTMQADFDARFTRTKTQYERVLQALEAKVVELRETHAGLVSGLEAIARGGLAATTLDDLEPLEEFDTDQPGSGSSKDAVPADDTPSPENTVSTEDTVPTEDTLSTERAVSTEDTPPTERASSGPYSNDDDTPQAEDTVSMDTVSIDTFSTDDTAEVPIGQPADTLSAELIDHAANGNGSASGNGHHGPTSSAG